MKQNWNFLRGVGVANPFYGQSYTFCLGLEVEDPKTFKFFKDTSVSSWNFYFVQLG